MQSSLINFQTYLLFCCFSTEIRVEGKECLKYIFNLLPFTKKIVYHFDIISKSHESFLAFLVLHDGMNYHIDGLVQERCNSIANTLHLSLSCTNPSICRPIVSICDTETLAALLVFVRGIYLSPVVLALCEGNPPVNWWISPHKELIMQSFHAFFVVSLTIE